MQRRIIDIKTGTLSVTWEDGAALEGDVEHFVRVLEGMCASGARFAAGQTVALGSFMLRVVADGEGFAFEEPAIPDEPERLVPGVSRAVGWTRVQRSVLESFGVEAAFDPPRLDMLCRLCSDIRRASRIDARRGPAGPGKSGWEFRCVDASHAHDEDAELMPLSRAVALAPQLLAVLPFPVGWSLIVDPDQIVGARDLAGRTRSPAPGSYVMQQAERSVERVRRALRVVFRAEPELAARAAAALDRSPDPLRAADQLLMRPPMDAAPHCPGQGVIRLQAGVAWLLPADRTELPPAISLMRDKERGRHLFWAVRYWERPSYNAFEAVPLPPGRALRVNDGQCVAWEPLTEGPLDPRQLLVIRGAQATMAHVQQELGALLPDLAPADIERLIAPLFAFLFVTEAGAGLEPGDIVSRQRWEDELTPRTRRSVREFLETVAAVDSSLVEDYLAQLDALDADALFDLAAGPIEERLRPLCGELVEFGALIHPRYPVAREHLAGIEELATDPVYGFVEGAAGA